MSLRTQLIASYLVLLSWAFGVVATFLFILLNNQPEPPTNTYQELYAIVRANRGELAEALAINARPSSVTRTIRNERLRQFAQENDVRLMLVNINSRSVNFDSQGVYPSSPIPLQLVLDSSFNPSRFSNWLPDLNNAIAGAFTDEISTPWLFLGIEINNLGDALILADVRPDRSLQSALVQFGSALGLPLLQSAAIGLAVAVILAAIISGTIARPLQNIAKATQAVAQGNYHHSVPVEGAPEVRSVAEAFNQMTEEVRKTQQSQRDFLANVSHDLKTPLTSIQGYSQAIMDGATKDPAHAAAIINDEAARLNRMVAELTDLARLQAGAASMHMEAIDVIKLVQAIVQRLTVVAQNKNIALHFATPPQPLPLVYADGDRLVQVFMNLISNAIHYTPEGGAVWVQLAPTQHGIEISIKDNGIGIPQEELPRIFERFYQVDKTRGPRRGTGLGLAITHEIIQAHNGTVRAISDGDHQGATFIVWLPTDANTSPIDAHPL